MRLRYAILIGAVLAVGSALAVPVAAPAQVPTLDRVDSLVTAGSYDDARRILDQWWSARDEFEIPGSNKARALMLRARLAPDLETAEPDYLAVILGYPTSEHAPEALLRLGQGLLADGDATRAAAYLERLVADYPGRPQRTMGLLWLARANTAAHRPAAACEAARKGIANASDPDVRAMLQVEAGASCAVRTSAAPAQPVDDRPEQPEQPRATGATDRGAYAAQAGAFRHRESAQNLMERLREAGHQPRLVRLPGSDLLRVRVGRFQTAEDARRLVARIQAAGFDAVLATDADEERQP